MSADTHGAPDGDFSFSSACEYFVCGHCDPVVPISANPTFPPFQRGSDRIAGSNTYRGSTQVCVPACMVVRVARGQKSPSMQESPFGGAARRSVSVGTNGKTPGGTVG